MEKVLLLTDSACDLTLEEEQQYAIRVLNMPIGVNGKEYIDRAEMTPDEMYQILNTCQELPTTSHINMVEFSEVFCQAASEGYTDVIYMGINSHGSNCHSAAVMGKELFYQQHPELQGKVHIHIVDSLSYSYGYGYPLVLAAQRLAQGASVQEILDFLQDFLRHRELYFAMYTLKFAKRSGRIGAAASFVGEVLGLRPIMVFEQGENVTADKVRGDKNVVPRLFEYYKQNVDENCLNYVLLMGEDPEPARQLQQLIEQYNGQSPDMVGKMGICVAINAGPQIVGISFRGRQGGHMVAEVE